MKTAVVPFADARTGLRVSRTFLAAFAGLCLMGAAPPPPTGVLRFAIVAKVANNPFFDAVQLGCNDRAKELSSDHPAFTCLYGGPGFTLVDPEPNRNSEKPAQAGNTNQLKTTSDTRSQAQIILDFAAAHVDGIAVSPSNDPTVAAAIHTAVNSGIPVVTFDTDAAEEFRAAFVGTNARDFGRALGASLRRWKPHGGKYAIVSTDPAQPNIAERIYGVRDGIGPGWSEIVDSPVVTTGDYTDAVQKIDHLLTSYYDVDAIISVGAWPMLASDAWRDMVGRYKVRIDKADVVLVVADALPVQKDLVRQGLGHVLVGQRPADMGARVADLLLALKAGQKVPEVVYVGFETFTRLDLSGQTN